ncbi:hypothetical protein GCM10009720_13150 [Yaniella flava]|uniref:Uncharacterized protein n=1 Tax=Yaniella flava TaxID=287930 RepID=A0ABN2UCH6_9MICC
MRPIIHAKPAKSPPPSVMSKPAAEMTIVSVSTDTYTLLFCAIGQRHSTRQVLTDPPKTGFQGVASSPEP